MSGERLGGQPEPPELADLDQLDAVAVGIADERDARTALAHLVRRLLGLDAVLGRQRPELAVEVVGGDRDVVVARAELVRVDAMVIGQLQPRPVSSGSA